MYRSADFLNSLSGKVDSISGYVVQHKKRFARTIAEINRHLKDVNDRSAVKILDVGSLGGELSIALKHEGYEVHSTDLELVATEFKRAYERNEIEIRAMTDSRTLPYEEDNFDGVVFCETLEHIYDNPLDILSEFKRVLKPGGFVLLTTPNVMRLENKIKFLLNINIYQDLARYVHYPSTQRLALHFREYTKKELIQLLQDYAKLPVDRVAMFDSPAGRTPFLRFVQRTMYLVNYVVPGFKNDILVIARKPA